MPSCPYGQLIPFEPLFDTDEGREGAREALTAIDWATAAALLAERITAPVAVLSKGNRIVSTNAAFQQLVGWSRAELAEQHWMERLTPRAALDVTRTLLAAARAGRIDAFELDVARRAGVDVTISVESQRIGDDAVGLVVFVRSSRPVARSLNAHSYLVQLATSEPHRVLEGACDKDTPARACYESIHGLDAPCLVCPLRPDPRQAHTVVRASAAANGFDLVSARPVGNDIVEVSVLTVLEADLARIRDARLEQISDRARLTDRERAVLARIVAGDPPESIATDLGIGARTVKFHQTNAFQKLGVDSRSDLLRLILI